MPEKMTLSKFIEDNHNLLSALAVFSALTAYFVTLPISWIATGLSFLSIMAMIMVFRELQSKAPDYRRVSLRLFIFNYSVIFGQYGLMLYWFLVYRDIWHLFLFIPLFVGTITFVNSASKPYLDLLGSWSLFRKHFFNDKGEPRWYLKVTSFIATSLVFIYAFTFAMGISQPLNYLMDQYVKSPFGLVLQTQDTNLTNSSSTR